MRRRAIGPVPCLTSRSAEALLAEYGEEGQRRVLTKQPRRTEFAVDLVRGHLDIAPDRMASGTFEQRLRALHVRPDEHGRALDAPIDMTLCREVQDRIKPFFAEELIHRHRVGDVGYDQSMPRMVDHTP